MEFVNLIFGMYRKGINWIWIKTLIISLFSTDSTWNRFLIKFIYHLIDIVNKGRKLNDDGYVIKQNIVTEIVSHFVVLIKSYKGKTGVGYICNRDMILKEIMRIGSEGHGNLPEALTDLFKLMLIYVINKFIISGYILTNIEWIYSFNIK